MNGDSEWVQTLSAGPLLGIAAAAVALLLYLVMRVRLHAFLALILVSLLTAAASGVPAGQIVTTATDGLGATLASVALLVALGAMLGRIIEASGGAQALADALVRRFGESRAPLALGIASLLYGFPIFFDAGLVVMLPIVFTVARRVGGSVLRYGLPVAGAFSVMHVFVPPHPGPVAASGLLGADVGLVVVLGLLTALPTWAVAGYWYGRRVGDRNVLPVPDVLGHTEVAPAPAGGAGGGPATGTAVRMVPPSVGTVIGILLLPLILIFANTGLDAASTAGWVDGEATWVQAVRAIGSTPVALLIAVLVAIYVLGVRRGEGAATMQDITERALGPVASVILITGAGGMFGAVLRASGIGDALATTLEEVGLPLIAAGFVIAAILRVAQGSATVALITAAGLVQPAVAAGGLSSVETAAVVLAVAAGSVIASHVNDSGFWLVGRFMGMDTRTTLTTWTVMETLIAVIGFAIAWVIFALG